MRLLASTTKRTFNHTARDSKRWGNRIHIKQISSLNAKKDIVIDEFSFAKLSLKHCCKIQYTSLV
jgi:hypothetical protein